MQRKTRLGAGLVVAAAAITGLVASGSGGALAAQQAAAPGTGPTSLRVVVTDHGTYVIGPTTFGAGRVKLAVESAREKDGAVAVVKLDPGYRWSEFRQDLKVAFRNLFAPDGDQKKGLRRLNHAIDHAAGYGGFDAPGGKVTRGTLLLDEPGGRYFVYNDSGRAPHDSTRLTVTAPEGPQTLVAGGTITAKTNRRFGGDDVLPNKGNIEFVNHSTQSPHFVELFHVKEGTTKKQVRQSLQADEEPSFVLPGYAFINVLGSGERASIHVDLPKGQYVAMCFFPDPEEGMPHAFMGMIKMYHLR